MFSTTRMTRENFIVPCREILTVI